jgi:DNA-binding transcriptional LysR family regulator
MPDQVVSHDIENGLLVEIDWEVPFGKGPVGVSYRGPDSLSPAGTAFLKALRHAAKAMQKS